MGGQAGEGAGRGFLPSLQSLRGLAALWVVLYHVEVELHNAAVPMLGISGMRAGWLGVDLFFVLSAYLLAPPFLDGRAPRYGRFLVDRFLRVAPAYYAAAAVGAAVLVVFFPERWDPLTALPSLLFLNNLTGETLWGINPVFWTLAVELQFYLLLPFLARLFTGRRWLWGLALCLAASYLFRGLTYISGNVPLGFGGIFWLPSFLGHFGLGLAAARIRTLPQPALATLAGCLLVGVPVALWIAPGSIAYGYESLAGHVLVRPLAACGFALLILAAATPGRMRLALEVRPLQALGNISYSLYLAHYPVQMVALWATGLPTRRTEYILVALAASLVYGAVLYALVERPAELLRRRLKARAAA